MANLVRIALAIALCLFKSAHAGYAQVSPPPSVVVRGAETYARVAANDGVFGRVIVKQAVVNVGGQSVKMPAAMRLASNAPRYAARFAFTPAGAAVIAACVAAGAIYAYYQSGGFEFHEGIWKRREPIEGTVFQIDSLNGWFSSGSKACNDFVDRKNKATPPSIGKYWVVTADNEKCTYSGELYDWDNGRLANTTPIPPSTTGYVTQKDKLYDPKYYPPATEQEFEDGMAGKPMPVEVPQNFPIEFPVEPQPWLNPKPKTSPSGDPSAPQEPELDPSGNPQPRPLRVPQGDPIPEPLTEGQPQQYRQPVVDIIPSPAIGDPWRVNIVPKDVVSTDPSPLTGPQIVPNPSDSTAPPAKTENKTPGLCDLYPDILACAKPELDTPEADQVKTKDVDIRLSPDSGWSTGGGSCPPPRQLHVANVQFDIKGVCDGLSMIRPIVLAFAWLLAAAIVVGANKRD